jgi:alpha-glucosidase
MRWRQIVSAPYSSLLLLALCCAAIPAASAKPVTLKSPDGRNDVTLDTEKLTYAVSRDGVQVIAPSPLGLNLDIGSLGAGARFTGMRQTSTDTTYPIVVGKAASAKDRHHQLELAFDAAPKAPRFSLLVRAYDDGVALRYVVPRQDGLAQFKVMSEATQFNFARDYTCWGANMGRFDSSFEGEYDPQPASRIRAYHNYMAPLVCKTGRGQTTFAIAEADVKNYPGFYLSGRNDAGLGLAVTLPPRFDNDRNYRMRKTVSAQVDLRSQDFQTPWRVVMLGDAPGALTASHLIPTLAAPSRIADTSWIKPAKTSWDWYNDWDVDLPGGAKPGIDTATYKAFVDFSHAMKLDDILIDAGWSVGSDFEPDPQADVMRAIPKIDMPELLAYAKSKGVGVWLWVQWQQLDNQMDAAFKQYQAWGIKGVKVDFMNRNDQEMVEWYHKVLEKAAAHKLMVNLHGAYPPNGLARTWPNYITQEGVLGAENNKWSARITARHNVTLPFTRMILGPMDYTPGGFVNATPASFTYRNHVPMSMTTRAHGLAMYVVYDSPFQMVADGPRAYRKADGSWADGAEFVQQVPTSWDETRVLAGDIGQYIVSARRKGDTWYIGAMTNEEGRTLNVPLDFLGKGSFDAQVMEDGAGPDQLRQSRRQAGAVRRLTLKLAPSGGAVAVIRPAQ